MQEEQPQQEKGPLPRTREAVDWWLNRWGRQAVVDGQEPMIREDVERLIEVNGGTAEGLYLWGARLEKANLMEVDLKGAQLSGAKLNGVYLGWSDHSGARLGYASLQDAGLSNANLQGADLFRANLQGAHLGYTNLRGTRLYSANLQNARLTDTDLQGANLAEADLRGARLIRAGIFPDTNLEGVKWDKDYINVLEREGNYEYAISLYRRLKRWYEEAGMLSIAGEFHYREREAARKAQWQKLGQEFKGLKQGVIEAWRRLKGQEATADQSE